ncbi:DUF3575 domain-containing protein [Cytophaga sp. FL35]|uniref:DUF3575 domain-containing protein n=1 Tax=Cytophaga sp. FL35 TaxID=1904456 RepID=UPI00165346FF|nr:DUF3575 domain-containing protein [Cytophaga sp. FL35]MBC6997696.1 DUF3575 domain-containing protein [Cytophaga sp. FL35]
MVRILTLACITLSIFNGICQTEAPPLKYKNQLSTNLLLPFFGSVDLSYERAVANKWAVGVGGALYGNGFENLSTNDYSYDQETKYEVAPFVRLYFNGAQKKSHFLEIFGSLSEVEESGRYIRHVNEEGYGVYTIGTKTFIVGGLGIGYGYRFLFLEDKLVLEPQFGIRTNFDVDFIFLNGALVRTGIKVGYRF